MPITPTIKDKESYPLVSTHITRNTYSAIVSSTAVAYAIGQQMGILLPVPMGSSSIGGAITIEQISILDQEHLEPDINVAIFVDNPSSSILTNGSYVTISTTDQFRYAGFIPIRAASGHWNAFFSGAATKSWSMATVQPFFSFVLGVPGATLQPNTFYLSLQAASATTRASANDLIVNITYRQG